MLAKCPSCGKSQEFKTLVKLKTGDNDTCKFCKAQYKLVFWKHSIAILFVMLPPFLLREVFSFYTGLLWLMAGFIGYFVFMPLRTVVLNQSSESDEKKSHLD